MTTTRDQIKEYADHLWRNHHAAVMDILRDPLSDRRDFVRLVHRHFHGYEHAGQVGNDLYDRVKREADAWRIAATALITMRDANRRLSPSEPELERWRAIYDAASTQADVAFAILGVDAADVDFTDWSYGEIPYTRTAQWDELYVYMRRHFWQVIDRDRNRALEVARDEPLLADIDGREHREDLAIDRLRSAFVCHVDAARDWLEQMRRTGERFPWDDAPIGYDEQ